MSAAAVARLFSVPVPVAIVEAVVPVDGPDLLVEDGLARPNPLLPGERYADVGAVWKAFAAWLAAADAPAERLLVDGVVLALDAGEREAARLLLRRVALGAVVAQTTPEPADALLRGGRVADLMALDPDAVCLLLADAGRSEVEPLLEAAWLRGRLALAQGRPGDAVVAPGDAWSDVVAADALCLTGRVDEAEARLERWFTSDGHLAGEHPPLLRGELLRAGARVFSEATRFEEAANARTDLEDLAAELGEPRVQLAVLLGRVGQGYRLGRFGDARRWLREFDELASRVPSAGLRDNADYIAAVLATYGGEDPDLAVRAARSTSRALALRVAMKLLVAATLNSGPALRGSTYSHASSRGEPSALTMAMLNAPRSRSLRRLSTRSGLWPDCEKPIAGWLCTRIGESCSVTTDIGSEATGTPASCMAK